MSVPRANASRGSRGARGAGLRPWRLAALACFAASAARAWVAGRAVSVSQRMEVRRDGVGGLGFRGLRRMSRTGLAALQPGRYRALTKIRLRKEPDVASEPTGATVIAGEEFEVFEAVDGTGDPGYLRLAEGWVFDQGIAGRWLGKPIVEPVNLAAPPAPEAAPAPEPEPEPAPAE
ncbi:unnamed protein product, partial [Effrenium voratum]